MLSNSKGLSGTILGARRETLSKLTTSCPHMRKNKKCRMFNKEESIRRTLATTKEKEIKKKAMEMVAAHQGLLRDAKEEGEASYAEVQTALGSVAHVENEERLLQHFIDEIKNEPAYRQWNLEAEVAEEMIRQGLKHCPFSHTVEVQSAVKRSRGEHERERRQVEKMAALKKEEEEGGNVTRERVWSKKAVGSARQKWERERRKVFSNFTPWQKAIVCILWQGEVTLPLKVVENVRHLVTHLAEQSFNSANQSVSYKDTFVSFPAFNTEEDLDLFLESKAFEDLVKQQEVRETRISFCKPALGIVNLSALPQVILYLNQFRKKRLITESTVSYFVEKSTPDDLLFLCSLSEKEMDVSQPRVAEELVTAVEWLLFAIGKERRMNPPPLPENELESPHKASALKDRLSYTNLKFTTSFPLLRSFVMQNVKLTQAEALVTSLYKHRMNEHLLALDLSHNNLSSMRFLFVLRAHYSERLLRLSLKNNTITRKPEYQEQVRLCLPKLTSLDGESIRRPPLRFPKPLTVPSSLHHIHVDPDVKPPKEALTAKEFTNIMETLSRLFYIFESGYLPHTALQRKRFHQQGLVTTVDEAYQLPDEELADEDNFPHRYLDPMCTFSASLAPGTSFFSPEQMRLSREVEFDDDYTGMRLSGEDLKEVKVLDVAMKSCSRNLILGRTAIRRMTRGPPDCYLAYRYSLYPERFEVDHHLGAAVVSILKIPSVSHPKGGKKAFSILSATRLDDTRYVVSLHGVMTWRLPSMKQYECITCGYERTITFVKKQLPLQNAEWEKLHSPPLVVLSDVVLLRPPPPLPLVPLTLRATRLVVQYGLEVCKEGEALVQAVMERCSSEAAEEAALDVLVFGPPAEDGGEEDKRLPHERDASRQVRELLASPVASLERMQQSSVVFSIFSVLEGRCSEEGSSQKGWGAELHFISTELLTAVTGIMNRNLTLNL